jgi:glycosyltransferase involved in cell wall biosynthesis
VFSYHAESVKTRGAFASRAFVRACIVVGRLVKVLLANKFFFNNGGSEAVMFQERSFLVGAHVDVVDFAMEDARNLSSDYAGDFVANQTYRGEEGLMGDSQIRSALKLIHSSEAVRKISELIERTRPDLVHCHNIYHQLTPSIIGAAKRLGVPVVLTLHDYKVICPVYLRLREGKVCSECADRGFSRVLTNRCAEGSLAKSGVLYVEAVVQKFLGNYEKVDAIIAPSEFMRASVTPRRFAPETVTVIPNGVDTTNVSASDRDLEYVVYMGRLSPEKGVETLLEAHSSIADRVDLVIAGTGTLERGLRAKYPRARFLGHLGTADLQRVVREASFVVVPSQCYENCPMAVLEAMAQAKAVVASDIGGIPELVVDGETGFLFPPGDHAMLRSRLLQLTGDRLLRTRLGLAGRKRAETGFSLEKHNDALMRLYESVIARSIHPTRRTLPGSNAR